MVKNAAKLFLGGPPIVKLATGEESTADQLGSADLHSKISGVSDALARNEVEAIKFARYWVATLNWSDSMGRPQALQPPKWDPLLPLHTMETLFDVAQANYKKPWDINHLVARITDGSRFSAFKPLYGSNTVCGFGYVAGYPLGFLGNNGVLNVSSIETSKVTSVFFQF